MKKSGRPSSAPKKIKDGYYILITRKNSKTPIRIMRENRNQLEQAKIQYKYHHFEYLGQVKGGFWVDGKNKGQATV